MDICVYNLSFVQSIHMTSINNFLFEILNFVSYMANQPYTMFLNEKFKVIFTVL